MDEADLGRDRAIFIAQRVWQAVRKAGIRDRLSLAEKAANDAAAEWDRAEEQQQQALSHEVRLELLHHHEATQPVHDFAQVDHRDEIAFLTQRLTLLEHQVVDLHYLQERTQKWIAGILGLSYREVKRQIRNALIRMRS